MKKGKHICETLKAIRCGIAQANDIDYNPTPCHHEGDCAGTCPKCESEVRWLERQLHIRQSLGKAITIAGLTIASGTFATSCNLFSDGTTDTAGAVELEVGDSTEHVPEGEVAMPDSLRLDECVPVDTNKNNLP